jgi:hypothetical protein
MRSAAGFLVAFDLARAVSEQTRKVRPSLTRWLRGPRVATSLTLLLVTLGAAAASLWSPRPTVVGTKMIATQATVAEAGTTRGEPQVVAVPRESVKIVVGTPRSDNCADQVWPYIEYRCLAVPAAGNPQMVAVSATASPPGAAMAPFEPVRAASANDDVRPESPATARRAIAIARLTLPPQRQGAGVSDGARGRSGDIGLSDSGRRTDGSVYPAMEQPTFGMPRQRAGRRAYRSRYGRGWDRRPPFGSLF